MTISVTTVWAPSAWASYLVNGDAPGLDEREKADADKWVAAIKPSFVVSTEDDDCGAEATGQSLYILHTIGTRAS